MMQTVLKLKGEHISQYKFGTMTNLTFDDFCNLTPVITDDKNNNEGYVLGEVDPPERKDANVKSRCWLNYDIDKCPYEFFDVVLEQFQERGIDAVAYTTWNHGIKDNRGRLVVNTDRNLESKEDYQNAYYNLIDEIPILKKLNDENYLDDSMATYSQFIFAPSYPEEREHLFRRERTRGGVPYKVNTQKKVEDVLSVVPKGLDDSIQEGGRNNYLTKVCGSLVKKYLDIGKVSIELHGRNIRQCKPPLPTEDVNTIIKSIWDTHFINNPDDKPTDINKQRGKFSITLGTGLEGMEEPDYLVDDILIHESVTMLFGQSTSTKSFLAIHLAMCKVHNRDFFGIGGDIDRPLKVIYNALEGQQGIRKRYKAWNTYYEKEPNDNFILLNGNPTLNKSSQFEEYREYLREIEFKGGVIIIDTLSQATPDMAENDAGEGSGVLGRCQELVQEFKCHVIVVHHSGKAEGSDYRGTSAYKGNLDAQIEVRRNGDDMWAEWHVKKVKDGEGSGNTYKYRLHKIKVGVSKRGKDVTSLAIEEMGVTKTKDSRQKLGKNQQYVMDLIRDRLKSYVDKKDKLSAVKADVISNMVTVDQHRRGHMFDEQVKALQNKKLLKAFMEYPTNEEVIQIVES